MVAARLVDFLKAALPRRAWLIVRGFATAIVTPLAFTIRTGHWRSSLTGKIVDRHGKPIPWYSYPMIEFLSQRDFRGARVLEFGGGHSTLWWLSEGADVVTIEENAKWCEWIRNRTTDAPAEIHHMPYDITSRDMGAVASFLSGRGETFDIVVVDGHLRPEAAVLSAEWLTSDGSMIIDNFDADSFRDVLSRPGCRLVEFTGPGANGSRPWTTALLFWVDCKLLAARPSVLAAVEAENEIRHSPAAHG